jgi:hypothetical protein
LSKTWRITQKTKMLPYTPTVLGVSASNIPLSKNNNTLFGAPTGGCEGYGCGSGNGIASNPRCPAGTVMVGLDGFEGSGPNHTGWTATLSSLLCQPLPDLFAQLSTNIQRIPFPYSAANHGSQRLLTLPPGNAVSALWLTSGKVLNALQLHGTDVTLLHPHATQSATYTDSGAGAHWMPCPANALAVGINCVLSTDWPSYVSKINLICQDQTQQVTTLMATLPVPYEDLRKCVGLDMYMPGDSKPTDAACAQLAAHYCLADTERLLECSYSNFCKSNRTACDAAYTSLCGSAFASATPTSANPNPAPLSDSDKKVCSCSWQNPMMHGVPGYNPACHNNDCLSPGMSYRTLEMQTSPPCAALTVCLNELLLQNVKQADLTNINFSNNCGNAAAATVTNPTSTAVQVSGTTTTVTPAGTTSNTLTTPDIVSPPMRTPSAPKQPTTIIPLVTPPPAVAQTKVVSAPTIVAPAVAPTTVSSILTKILPATLTQTVPTTPATTTLTVPAAPAGPATATTIPILMPAVPATTTTNPMMPANPATTTTTLMMPAAPATTTTTTPVPSNPASTTTITNPIPAGPATTTTTTTSVPAASAAAETGMSHQAKIISIILLVLVLSAATAYGVRRFLSLPKQNEKPPA